MTTRGRREIKFRGLTIDTKRWVYGLLNNNPKGKYIISNEHNFYFVDPETIGEFTGLKDKNRKEIFESDIVNFNNKEEYKLSKGVYPLRYVSEIGVIVFKNGSFIIDKKLYGSNLLFNFVNPVFNGDIPQIEVIGNIYENLELLTVSNQFQATRRTAI